MLKRQKKQFHRHKRKPQSHRKLIRLKKERNKQKIPRLVKVMFRKASRRAIRNVDLRMRLANFFGWGKITFGRSLNRMRSRGRIPRHRPPIFKER